MVLVSTHLSELWILSPQSVLSSCILLNSLTVSGDLKMCLHSWTWRVWHVCCTSDLLPLPAQEKEGTWLAVPVSERGWCWRQCLFCSCLWPAVSSVCVCLWSMCSAYICQWLRRRDPGPEWLVTSLNIFINTCDEKVGSSLSYWPWANIVRLEHHVNTVSGRPEMTAMLITKWKQFGGTASYRIINELLHLYSTSELTWNMLLLKLSYILYLLCWSEIHNILFFGPHFAIFFLALDQTQIC